MKKISNIFLLTPLMLVAMSSLTSCNANKGLVLRVLNSEDYIYLGESNDPEDKDLIHRFEDYIEANYPEYKGVKVIYDTSDTNETIYSEIQTGKSNYDLINVSEYMAQKIVSGGFATPLDLDRIPNYEKFASKEIKNRLDNIIATPKEYNEETKKYEEVPTPLKDYAVGYMWGTLGILFNPDYFSFDNDEVVTDMMSFDALWDAKYKGTISIKNSMRDTYALGVMHTYEDEFEALKNQLESGDIAEEEYKEEFSKIFNRCDEKSVKEVQASLEELKNNIFGLEVDSGKQDIITQKIGVNLAWSGDATYSMEQGADVGVDLYYSVPELGSNIWSDVWIMPNNSRSEAQNELAHLFLDYLCSPEIATLNMAYTGYTSFIGGDDILELARDWYDYRTDEIYQTVEVDGEEESYQVYADNSGEVYAIDYPDFLKDEHDLSMDDAELLYFIPYEKEEDGDMVIIEEPLDYDDFLAHSEPVYLLDENEEETEDIKTYGDLTIVDADDSELEEVDLSYFFNGTFYETPEDKYGEEEYQEMLDNGIEPVLYHDNIDTIFYSDNYLPYTYEDENGDEQQNICVGHAFFCQYPSQETITRCAVMEDYGVNNNNVMKMWENFKSDPLPLWAVIIFIIFIATVVLFITYIITAKILIKKVRKSRISQ